MTNKNLFRSNGFTLIEVMIAVIILAVGLLGLASLVVQGQQSNESAYSRSQATLLAYDIIDRMRANKVAFSPSEPRKVSYATQANTYVLTSLPSCTASAAGTPAFGNALATQDINQWCASVRSGIPSVDSGNTRITRNGNLYTVNIQWQETGANGVSTQAVEALAEL